jgi:hypothetical protein
MAIDLRLICRRLLIVLVMYLGELVSMLFYIQLKSISSERKSLAKRTVDFNT